MIKQAAKKTGKTAAKRAPAKPAAKRPTAKKAAPQSAAKRPLGRPAATKPAAPEVKVDKTKKTKPVRDSFTMPEAEYALIGSIKKACLGAGFEIKKSEILRIGVTMLAKLDPKKIKTAQAALEPLKAGRPQKHK